MLALITAVSETAQGRAFPTGASASSPESFMKAYRRIADLPLNRRAKAFAGRFLGYLNPALSEAVHREPFDPNWGPAGKLVRNAHLARAVKNRDHRTLRHFFTHYWSSATAVEFFEGFADRFETLFLRHHAGIASEIAAALPLPGGRARLVEVGSGDGRVLEWLSREISEVSEFHGVDLNAREIEKCQTRHVGSERLFFHWGDVLKWLKDKPAPGTVLVTNGGVFEYLLEEELRELFGELSRLCSPCLVAITETVAVDHDLASETASLPYGYEFAFSHNYPALLRESGFEIRWERDRVTLPGEENHPARWFQMVAVAT